MLHEEPADAITAARTVVSEWLDAPDEPLGQLEKLRLLSEAMTDLQDAIAARRAAAVRKLIEAEGTTIAALKLNVPPIELIAEARSA
ncbi:hypothetical protein [Aeromicrobium alkaliterrae]|uniref:Uncharacterized protein n=1 Tax=Aeromicrobium alkaliterrae TaxID=302168 RepID=A0ABN2JIG9_9ACTN